MSKKRKNIIDIRNSIDLLEQGYGFEVEIFNYYQFRIRYEESDYFYDWYHTSGKLVENRNGGCKGFDQLFLSAESVALFIKNRFI